MKLIFSLFSLNQFLRRKYKTILIYSKIGSYLIFNYFEKFQHTRFLERRCNVKVKTSSQWFLFELVIFYWVLFNLKYWNLLSYYWFYIFKILYPFIIKLYINLELKQKKIFLLHLTLFRLIRLSADWNHLLVNIYVYLFLCNIYKIILI